MSSLVVSCQCGQSFAASPELAGQTLPCPNCSRPLTVARPAPPHAPQAPAPTPYAPAYAEAGYAAAPLAAGFAAPQAAPPFGQQNLVAPAMADPYAMPGYGQASYGQPAFGHPGYGQPPLDYGAPVGGALNSGGGEIAASTTVKALIGVAIGVVVLLVAAIIGEKIYAARQNAPRPVAAVPAADPSKPAASVPAPVGSFVPKPAPKPEPAATPVSIPAPSTQAPPGMQAYSVPGKFTIFAPTAYSWRAQPEQSVGRGITASAYIGTAPDNSALTVSIISSPIKAQKDRRDFLRGASGGMTRGAAGMTLVDSQGFNPTGTVPDHLEVQITMQGFNGVSVYGKGFIRFGKKRTSMVMIMAQDIGVRDSMMQSVNSFKEL